MDGPLPKYRAMIADGTLNPDPLQNIVLEKLQLLWLRLGERTYERDKQRPPNQNAVSTFTASCKTCMEG